MSYPAVDAARRMEKQGFAITTGILLGLAAMPTLTHLLNKLTGHKPGKAPPTPVMAPAARRQMWARVLPTHFMTQQQSPFLGPAYRSPVDVTRQHPFLRTARGLHQFRAARPGP